MAIYEEVVNIGSNLPLPGFIFFLTLLRATLMSYELLSDHIYVIFYKNVSHLET